MLKEGFEKYNTDDWLAEQIKRESRISAWDFDEGKRVRSEHEQDCDARAVALEHAENCEAEEVAEEHIREHNSRGQRTVTTSRNKKTRFPVFLIIDFILIFLMLGFQDFYWYEGVGPYFIIFMLMNPIVILYIVFAKKLPSNIYYIIVFVLALIIEIYTILMNYIYIRL